MRRATARVDVMPFLPVVFGLGEIEAAAAIGVSASKFRALVKDGRMPSPRRIDGRAIWDVDELRAAFKALPHEGEMERTSLSGARRVVTYCRNHTNALLDEPRVWGGVERVAKALFRRRYLSPRAVKQLLGDAFFVGVQRSRASSD
jgi:predicted DNA-binding transcriptional regulator AlpA